MIVLLLRNLELISLYSILKVLKLSFIWGSSSVDRARILGNLLKVTYSNFLFALLTPWSLVRIQPAPCLSKNYILPRGLKV